MGSLCRHENVRAVTRSCVPLSEGCIFRPHLFITTFTLLYRSLKANAGSLTNFEVLDFLQSRGALNDPTRLMSSVTPSEFKVN